MKVKTVHEHHNPFGDAYQKKVGDVYDLPDDHAIALIEGAIVERVPAADKAVVKAIARQ